MFHLVYLLVYTRQNQKSTINMCFIDNHNYRCYNHPMNRDIERWLIIGLCMILVLMSLQSCSTGKTEAKPTETPNVNVYNGTLSEVLGCMFAPLECQKLKNKQSQKEPHKDQSEYQDDITKEMMEMDEEVSKETN